METETLSAEEVWELRNQAIKEFYLRPRFLWRKLTSARSPMELWRSVENGFALLSTSD